MTEFLAMGVLIAHEGGWDEILLVGGPIVIIFVLLGIAKRRVDAGAGNDPGDHVGDQPGDHVGEHVSDD